MATKIPSNVSKVAGTRRVVWTLANGDVGAPVEAPDHAFKEIQVKGTFGAGGSVSLEGSLDAGTADGALADGSDRTWATLNDPQGNALTFTSARLERVQESTATIRPNVTAGDGTTALVVTVILKLDGPTAS